MIYTVFIGGYSQKLFRGEFDSITGALKLTESLDIDSPSYVCTEGDVLYGVSETDTYKKNSGGLFSVSIKNNEMNLISFESTNGKHPCHLYMYDKYIFVSNYTEGTLSIFEKSKDGAIKPSCKSIAHYGSSINQQRQEKAHIHFASMSPCGRYLAVCDLGLDKVFLYPYTVEHGLSTDAKVIDCTPGSGPRHLVFSGDGKIIYVLAELTGAVMAYRDTGDAFQLMQEISILPADFKCKNTAAAIHISPDKRFIAASNRGHDSIALCKIKADKTLESPEFLMTGSEPRDFRYSPDGNWILSANQNDDTVTVYNPEKLNETAYETSVPAPTCIVFA